MQLDAKRRARGMAKDVEIIKAEWRNKAADVKRSIMVGKETKAAAEKVTNGPGDCGNR